LYVTTDERLPDAGPGLVFEREPGTEDRFYDDTGVPRSTVSPLGKTSTKGPAEADGIAKNHITDFPSSLHADATTVAGPPAPEVAITARPASASALPEATDARIPRRSPAGGLWSGPTGIQPCPSLSVLPGVATLPPYRKSPTAVWNISDVVASLETAAALMTTLETVSLLVPTTTVSVNANWAVGAAVGAAVGVGGGVTIGVAAGVTRGARLGKTVDWTDPQADAVATQMTAMAVSLDNFT
jgi:hypothetical protein